MLTIPAWHEADDGDTLFGIAAIADYLALPFLDVRTMIEMGRLPTWKVGRCHSTRRSSLAAHWLSIERAALADDRPAPPPVNVLVHDALGLLSGYAPMAAALGQTIGGIRHHRQANGLPVFMLGKTPFARLASLRRWQELTADQSRATRWRASMAAHWKG